MSPGADRIIPRRTRAPPFARKQALLVFWLPCLTSWTRFHWRALVVPHPFSPPPPPLPTLVSQVGVGVPPLHRRHCGRLVCPLQGRNLLVGPRDGHGLCRDRSDRAGGCADHPRRGAGHSACLPRVIVALLEGTYARGCCGCTVRSDCEVRGCRGESATPPVVSSPARTTLAAAAPLEKPLDASRLTDCERLSGLPCSCFLMSFARLMSFPRLMPPFVLSPQFHWDSIPAHPDDFPAPSSANRRRIGNAVASPV